MHLKPKMLKAKNFPTTHLVQKISLLAHIKAKDAYLPKKKKAKDAFLSQDFFFLLKTFQLSATALVE